MTEKDKKKTIKYRKNCQKIKKWHYKKSFSCPE